MKWVRLTGDNSVADYLEEIVLHDTDRYVRCQAIMCYAESAGTAAIPVLRQLLDDKTETEFHCEWPPCYLIAGMAQNMLAEVEPKAKDE